MLPVRRQDSWPATVIGFDTFDNPLVLDEHFTKSLLLSVADLHHDSPLRTESPATFPGKFAIEVQPVVATVQRDTWVVVPYFGGERVDLRGRNVRRVGDDQAEGQMRRESSESVAGVELDSGVNPVEQRVLPRHSEGFGRHVQRMQVKMGTLGGEDDGDAAAAGAEIQDGQRWRAERGKVLPRAFSEHLGFRARNE